MRAPPLHPRILLFALGTAVLGTVVFGLASPLRPISFQALAGRSLGSVDQARLRRWLVVAQLAASMVLLVGSGLLARSFSRLQSQSLGFDSSNVVTLTISLGSKDYPTAVAQQAFFHRLQRALQYGPGISELAITDSLPPGGEHHDQIFASIAPAGAPPQKAGTGGSVAWRWVTPDYFHLLHIPILRGQTFTEDQRTSPQHFVVLSKRLAERLFPASDPIGRQIRLAMGAPEARNPPYTVTGVAADVKNGGLAAGDDPEYSRLRRDTPDDWDREATFVLKTNLPAETIDPWLRAQVANLDPTVPVKLGALQQTVSALADEPRFEAFLVGLFAAIGLVLAAVGLFGVIAFLVAQRTQEIGVRLALGASRANILALFLRDGLRITLPGICLGLLLSFLLSKALTGLLFHVSPYDPLVLAAAAGALLLIAISATLIPARVATRIEPSTILRHE